MPSAAEVHDAMVAAYNAQRARLQPSTGPDRWARLSARFRQDPHRQPEAGLKAIMEYLRPEDTLLDVGGGAGRYALPLALRCREAVVVDPSEAMKHEFEASAAEASVKNARFVQRDWLEDGEPATGDVSLVANVTYFVPDIRRFLDGLIASTRRRAIIAVISVPPPNGGADLFPLVYGEEQAQVPGYRELLPVLWDMGVLPEIRVVPVTPLEPATAPASRQEAIDSILGGDAWSTAETRERARGAFEERFDEIFVRTPQGFVRRKAPDPRQLLITWETH